MPPSIQRRLQVAAETMGEAKEFCAGFRDRLVSALNMRGMNMLQLGHLVGASRENVRQWKLGSHMPRTYKIVCIAKALNVDPAWLAFGRASVEPDAE